ncbi:MAG: carboxypeptidase-like regulatory domain-containing protein, partial [Planctomycetota bacterium]
GSVHPGPSRWTDGDGLAPAGGLGPDGSYELCVTPPPDRKDLDEYVDGDWTPADEVVVLPRRMAISGTVRDPQGRPVPGAEVWYREGEGGDWRFRSVAGDGRFRLPVLREGTCWLLARRNSARGDPGPFPGWLRHLRCPPDEEAAKHAVPVEAGTTGVGLVLDPGLVLAVRIAPWTLRPGEDGPDIGVRGRGGDDDDRREIATPDADGRVRFAGCAANTTYDVFGVLRPDRYVLGPGLSPGNVEIVLEPKRGGAITGRLLPPDGTPGLPAWATCWADVLGTAVPGVVERDGTFVIRALHPGRWTIHAYAFDDAIDLAGTARAAPGESVDVSLAPDEEVPVIEVR